ncbi:LacI family DNA-binding transcriptional regulator [Bifidobacterium jacchi]|uniref:LacI family DNA-binding transcriptional regulator n=1 Tax=Bifidobacterium jacchi TaxID=2490545 RepID=A0A5N5RLB2_9BIFI|nr:LacI family DNA-binding transcriptional regulator [Bifidobacterium jacchi]KAB5608084.1 LacI family DNA-binding transcriptional regulator [Bifidobacterium jacchi]
MFEVAKLAGVSHQTVSRVINNSPDVTATTRARVQAAIDQLGYRPSNSARALASRKSRTIGLIAGGMRFYGPVSTIAAIEEVSREHRLFMSVTMVQEATCSREDFENICGMFNEQNVDAFILLTPTDTMFEAACRMRVSQPRVIVASTHGEWGAQEGKRVMRGHDHVSMLGIDQWGAMGDVAHLLGQYGHRRVLYFAGPQEWRDARTRLEGWNRAARERSISSATLRCETWGSSEAYARMNHVLESIGSSGGVLPTAIVTANDAQAVGVIRALYEHSIRIPQDVSVVGFDDLPAMDNLYPPLTTVQPDFAQLGTSAMRETLRLLGDGRNPAFASSAHGVGLIPAKVMVRRSLGAARPR